MTSGPPRFTVVRSARRRRTLQLRYEPGRGLVVLAPLRAPASDIQALVDRHGARVLERARQAAALHPARLLETGDRLPHLGEDLLLCVTEARGSRSTVRAGGGVIVVSIPATIGADPRGAVETALTRWYRRRAAEHFAARVAAWAPAVGVSPKAVFERDQRRRWGSCAPDGTVRLNWRLTLAEPGIVDYVVVHELCHLRQRNHGPAFWAEVARVLPDYTQWRRRLREIGPGLRLSIGAPE